MYIHLYVQCWRQERAKSPRSLAERGPPCLRPHSSLVLLLGLGIMISIIISSISSITITSSISIICHVMCSISVISIMLIVDC